MVKLFLFVLLASPAAASSLLERSVSDLDALKAQGQALGKDIRESAAEGCYKLYRVVDWKPAGGPDSAYKRWHDWTSYLSTKMIPNIEGIMTPWSHQIRAENLWLTQPKIAEAGLQGLLTLEKNDFPMDSTWDAIWTKRVTLPMGTPVVYRSVILDREFRAALTWSVEKDRGLCRLPWVAGADF